MNRSDTFDRTDSAALATNLGTPSDSGSAWIPRNGSFRVVSNKAKNTQHLSASLDSYTVLECGEANGTLSVNLVDETQECGLIFRMNSSGDGWAVTQRKVSTAPYVALHAVQNHLITSEVTSFTGGTIAANSLLKVHMAGRWFTVYLDGVQLFQYETPTEQDLTNTLHGIVGKDDSTNAQFDNFLFTSSSPGGPPAGGVMDVLNDVLDTIRTVVGPVVRAALPPASFFLKNGFRSLISIDANPAIKLWEKSLVPPGIDGGPLVPLGDMWNKKFRSFAPGDLATVTEARAVVAYDPAVIDEIQAVVNVESVVTIQFPNGKYWAAEGVLQKFTPGDMVDGIQPAALVVFAFLMQDPDELNFPETKIKYQ